jgi:hypothetical protein
MNREECLYNYSQWHWVADRFGEGYSLSELASFLDVSAKCVSDNLERVGRKLSREKREPLNTFTKEFNALADDGSPVVTKCIAVEGVGRSGEILHFKSVSEAARFSGVEVCQISNAIRHGYRCRGYHWRKEEI